MEKSRGLTPVGTPDDGRVAHASGGGDSEVRKLDAPVLIGKDVGALDVAMDDTLIMKIYKTLEDL